MRIDTDSFKEVLDTITRNKGRSILTGFGIFWGVFMLILLSGGGDGLKQMIISQIASFSANAAVIGSGTTSKPYKGFGEGRHIEFVRTDIETIRQAVPELDNISPLYGQWGRNMKRDKYVFNGSVKGVLPDYQKIEDPQISMGRYLNEMDELQARKVCVLGENVYTTLFPDGSDPIGSNIVVDSVYYKVVGVSSLVSNSININGPGYKSIMIPANTFRQIYNTGEKLEVIIMSVKEGYEMKPVLERVKNILARHHLYDPKDESASWPVNTQLFFKFFESVNRGLDFLIWLVGLGTILAGAIGVSNIMMVSVKERTIEIGIRRAIGATPFMILSQVIVETIVLTLIAGMSGIVAAVGLLNLLETGVASMGTPAEFQVSFSMAMGAALLLMVFGVLAGLAPALRAMNIKPVDAMRDE